MIKNSNNTTTTTNHIIWTSIANNYYWTHYYHTLLPIIINLHGNINRFSCWTIVVVNKIMI